MKYAVRIQSLKGIIEKYLLRYPLGASLIIHLLLFVFYLIFYTPYFQTNDDTTMLLYLSGKLIAKENTEYVLFINFVLARFLKNLYLYFPDFPWYGGIFILFLYTSFSYVLYLLLFRLPRLIVLTLYLLFFIFLGYTVLVSLQFTSVSGVMAIAGLWGLLFSQKHGKLFWGYSPIILGALLYFLSALLRFESWLLVSALFIPIGLFVFLKEKKSFLYRFIPSGIAVLLGLLLFRYHQYQYEKDDNYAAFNQLRGELLDYNLMGKLAISQRSAALHSVGWTETELALLNVWMYMDTSIYSYQKLEKLVQAGKSVQRIHEVPWWESGVLFITEILKEQKKHLILTLLFFAILLPWVRKSGILLFIVQVLFSFFLFSAMSWYLKPPPPRIVINGLLTLGFIPLFYLKENLRFGDYLSTPFQKGFAIIRLGLLGVYLLYGGVMSWIYFDCAARSIPKQQAFEQDIRRLETMRPTKKHFVSWGGAYPIEHISPFRSTHFMDSVQIFTLSALARDKTSQQLMRGMGITDFHRQVFNDSTLFFIFDNRFKQDLLELNRFQQKHYGQSILPEYNGKAINPFNCVFTLIATPEMIPDSVLSAKLDTIYAQSLTTQPLK